MEPKSYIATTLFIHIIMVRFEYLKRKRQHPAANRRRREEAQIKKSFFAFFFPLG
jgi:hypothetical protein